MGSPSVPSVTPRRGVVVSSTAFGPRARVEGTRLDAWMVVDALAAEGATAETVAEHFAVASDVVEAAVAYAGEFPERLAAEREAFLVASRAAAQRLPHVG